MDLQERCQDWNRSDLAIQAEMKQHFSTELQINRTDPSIMPQQE